MDNKTLIVIVGPTAVGKTAAAISLAQYYHTSILSADSRQFYQEMAIGTAKPTPAELALAPHYFVDTHQVSQNFNVGDFEIEGLKILKGLFTNNNIVVMAGGSGLYVKAICEGFDNLPAADPAVREQLNNQLAIHGLKHLQNRLRLADAVYYNEVDINNPQRVIRALEVFDSTGRPFSLYRNAIKNKRPFNIIKIGLNLPRELLYDLINKRVDVMLANGLVNEVNSLLPYREFNALKTVGYNEIFDYLDGKTNLATAIELIKQHTRQFAKRQLTWFKKDPTIFWINPLQNNIIDVAGKLLKA